MLSLRTIQNSYRLDLEHWALDSRLTPRFSKYNAVCVVFSHSLSLAPRLEHSGVWHELCVHMCPSVTCVQSRPHKNPSPGSPWAPIASISLLLQWHTRPVSCSSQQWALLARACACVPCCQPFTPAPPGARPDRLRLSWLQRGEEYNPFRGAASVCTHIWLVRLHLVPVERGLSARLHPEELTQQRRRTRCW